MSFVSKLRSLAAMQHRMVISKPLQQHQHTVHATGARYITSYVQLPEEHKMVYDMCRKLADEEIAPNAKTWDQQHTFPTSAIQQLVCCLYPMCSTLYMIYRLLLRN